MTRPLWYSDIDGQGNDQITVTKVRRTGTEHLALDWGYMATILQKENYFIYFIHLFTKFTEMYSHWPNQQLSSIGSDNGSAPNRHQAIMTA